MAVESEEMNQESDNWMSTYTMLTAEKLLKDMGLKFSPTILLQQAKSRDSFYYKLFKLRAYNAYARLIHQQAIDLDTYSLQKIVNYLLSGEADRGDDESGADTRVQIEKLRKEIMLTSINLAGLESYFEQEDLEVLTRCIEARMNWDNLVYDTVNKIVDLLQQHGIKVDNDKGKQRLVELIDQQAAGVQVSEDTKKLLKIKQENISPLVKSIIQLISEIALDKIDKNLRKLIAEVDTLEVEFTASKKQMLAFVDDKAKKADVMVEVEKIALSEEQEYKIRVDRLFAELSAETHALPENFAVEQEVKDNIENIKPMGEDEKGKT